MDRQTRTSTVAEDASRLQDEGVGFHRRAWRVQVVGRWIVAAIVLAGLAGLFGGGPLSHAHREDDGGRMRVDYERIARARSPFEVRVAVSASALKRGRAGVWFDDVLLRGIRVQSVSPEPVLVEDGDGRTVFTFAGTGEGAPLVAVFWVSATEWGLQKGRVGIVDGPELELVRWIHP